MSYEGKIHHKGTWVLTLFVADAFLSVSMIPILAIETSVGYTDSVIGSGIIFLGILIFGTATIFTEKIDRKYGVHKKVVQKLKKKKQ